MIKDVDYWIEQYDMVYQKFCLVYNTDDYILQAILLDQLARINNQIRLKQAKKQKKLRRK